MSIFKALQDERTIEKGAKKLQNSHRSCCVMHPCVWDIFACYHSPMRLTSCALHMG